MEGSSSLLDHTSAHMLAEAHTPRVRMSPVLRLETKTLALRLQCTNHNLRKDDVLAAHQAWYELQILAPGLVEYSVRWYLLPTLEVETTALSSCILCQDEFVAGLLNDLVFLVLRRHGAVMKRIGLLDRYAERRTVDGNMPRPPNRDLLDYVPWEIRTNYVA